MPKAVDRRAATPAAASSAGATGREQRDQQAAGPRARRAMPATLAATPERRELQRRTARAPVAATRRSSGASPRYRDGGADSATRRAPRATAGEDHRDQRGRVRETARRARASAAPRAADRGRSPSAGPASTRACSHVEVRIERIARRQVGDEQPIRRAIAGLQQVRRGHVVEVDEQARADREQPARDFGFLLHDRAATLSVASPTAMESPTLTPRRAASRASGHASPRGGMPVARRAIGARGDRRA